MPDADIVLSKVASIQKCLRRIQDVTGMDPETLDNLNVQDIFVLNLQRAIQSSIDLATHVVAAEGFGLANTIKENFEMLQGRKMITKMLSQRLQAMVGFRNIAIHDYQTLNVEILKAILVKHLKDLEDFYTAIVKHFGIARKKRKRRKK